MKAFRVETIAGLTAMLAQVTKLVNDMLKDELVAVVEVKEGRRGRTNPQNNKLWALLRDISEQVVWHGQKFTDEDWKDIFTAALKGQKSAPGITGGLVFFGQRTSKMDVQLMSDLFELIYSFGAERNVKWSEPK